MNSYKEYINNRIEGMYNILETSDIITEEFKKKSKLAKKSSRNSFLNFLKQEHPKDDIDKMIKDNSEENKKEFVKKYQKDFDKWKLMNSISGVVDFFVWFF